MGHMDMDYRIIARTDSAAGTHGVGAALATCLQAGDLVLLTGDLGAGKTQLVQGVALGLGADELPTSPTFNIVLSYMTGRLGLHHFDLYRLEEEAQLEDIALREYLESGGVCFVEWAEKFPAAFDEFLSVRIAKAGEGEREFSACARGVRAAQLLEQWKAALSNVVGTDRKGASAAPSAGEGPEMAIQEQVSQLGEGTFPSIEGIEDAPLVLAFDTANEVVALALGLLDDATRSVHLLAERQIQAHRASNTQLVPQIDRLLREYGIGRDRIACVCAGRGPGSFTGVRIALATAKGMASALGVGLVGVSSLDAVAWNAWSKGLRGKALVVADAMRKEVYPVQYQLAGDGVNRLGADRVVKAEAFREELGEDGLIILGDGLVKYCDLYEPFGDIASEELWAVSGCGLLLALQAAWRADLAYPLDARAHDPAFALPVYTRLSDAEENERIRLASSPTYPVHATPKLNIKLQ